MSKLFKESVNFLKSMKREYFLFLIVRNSFMLHLFSSYNDKCAKLTYLD